MSRGVVLVSGASGGIGAACARDLAARGFTVVAGVRTAPVEAVPGVQPVPLDITNGDSIAGAVAHAVSLAGGAGLAGLVNNAGISVMGPVEAVPLNELRSQFEVNVFGTVALTQACLPELRRGRGRIVIMSSIAGLSPTPYSGAYAASKFALEALADVLRLELRHAGIAVSLIEPGAIHTPIWGKVEASWEALAATADPTALRHYDEDIGRMRLALASYRRTAIPPERVARAVVQALTARTPRTRYLVGAEAHLRAALRAWLPDRVHDALVRRILKLP
jgi:NAD(P)-dependent dehydrogenase (short-subunit alcohol dehydrogenase family)